MNSNKIIEPKSTSEAEIAMNLHYLAEAIIKCIPDDTCVGNIFGVGEDDLVMQLYPYAQLIVKLSDKAYDEGANFSGVFVYEAMEELAELFMGIVDRQNASPLECEMPDIDEFELDILRVIKTFELEVRRVLENSP